MADDKLSCTAPTHDLKTFNHLMTIKENTCIRGTKKYVRLAKRETLREGVTVKILNQLVKITTKLSR